MVDRIPQPRFSGEGVSLETQWDTVSQNLNGAGWEKTIKGVFDYDNDALKVGFRLPSGLCVVEPVTAMKLLPTGDDGELYQELSAQVDDEQSLALHYEGYYNHRFGRVFDVMVGLARAPKGSNGKVPKTASVRAELATGMPVIDDSVLDDFLYSPGEVASMFGVNTKTVGRWARSGKIDAIRTPGGHRRFRASEIKRAQKGGES
jgi:excisionase family DNA binding protein